MPCVFMALVTMTLAIRLGNWLALGMLIFKTPLHEGKTSVFSLKLLDRGRRGEGEVERMVWIETLSSVLSTVQWVCAWTSICPQKDVFLKLILPPVSFLSSEIQKKSVGGEGQAMRKREAISLPAYIHLKRSFWSQMGLRKCFHLWKLAERIAE